MSNYNDLDKSYLAQEKYTFIVKQIQVFEKNLDNEHEIGIRLLSIDKSITMHITEMSYQNPDIIYFFGFVDGMETQIIQHVNQLNIMLTAVRRVDTSTPPKRIGYLF